MSRAKRKVKVDETKYSLHRTRHPKLIEGEEPYYYIEGLYQMFIDMGSCEPLYRLKFWRLLWNKSDAQTQEWRRILPTRKRDFGVLKLIRWTKPEAETII